MMKLDSLCPEPGNLRCRFGKDGRFSLKGLYKPQNAVQNSILQGRGVKGNLSEPRSVATLPIYFHVVGNDLWLVSNGDWNQSGKYSYKKLFKNEVTT